MAAAPVFISRKFPPSIGGMETLAAGVWRSVQSVRPDATLIAHGGANRALALWLPLAMSKLIILIVRGRVESVLTGDALMNALVAPLLWVARIPRATMVMGLDVTFQNRLYRFIVYPVLRRTATVVAISRATALATEAAGVEPNRISVFRLGVAVPPGPSRDDSRKTICDRAEIGPTEVVLLTLGRLVPRKGVGWFVANVMPRLPTSVHYVVAGNGPDEAAIRAAAAEHHLLDRVHLFGQVDENGREELLRGADLFVQPNIPIAGDMEGFGLVTIEAVLRGTPVIAADLEGIKDAVVDGRTGILLPPQDAGAWAARISDLLEGRVNLADLGGEFQDAAETLFGEHSMGEELNKLMGWARVSS